MKTHEVLNQPPPLDGYNVIDGDQPLHEGLKREGGAWVLPKLTELGALAGGEAMAWGRQANDNPPQLRAFDACLNHPKFSLLASPISIRCWSKATFRAGKSPSKGC